MTSTATTVQSEQPAAATPVDVTHVAETLADAFLADPVLSWCYPDPHRRAAILPQAFGLIADTYLPDGGIYTTSNHAAAAVWVPPTAEVDEERLGSQLGQMSGQDADRLFTVFELLEEHHPHDQAHQYLFLLGTRTAWQGQGLGSRLLRVVLDECDRDGTPAYLEATSERNKALYERHGFEVTEVLELPDGGPNLWCMWRNA